MKVICAIESTELCSQSSLGATFVGNLPAVNLSEVDLPGENFPCGFLLGAN